MIDYIKWNDDFLIGIGHLDSQHKEIFNIINLLKHAIDRGQGNSIIHYTIQKMVDYSIFHFTSEEEHMEENIYPYFDAHKKEHGLYIKRVSEFQDEYLSEKNDLDKEILEFLVKWWINHIQKIDKKYASFQRTFSS